MSVEYDDRRCAMFKILVVEDDRDLNRTVCAFLNHSGYEATGCLNVFLWSRGNNTTSRLPIYACPLLYPT